MHERLRGGAGACSGALVLVAALAVPSVATAKPADVNVVNVPTVRLDAAANTVKFDPEANAVKLDAAANTVRIHPSANAVTLAPNSQYTDGVEMSAVTGGSGACSVRSFELPPGERIALDSVYVDFDVAKPADGPRASIRLRRKSGDSTFNIFDIGVPVTVPNAFGRATGTLPLDGMVVRGASLDTAQIGDIFHVDMCGNRGTATESGMEALLVGHRGG